MKALAVTITLILICGAAVFTVADRYPNLTWEVLHSFPRLYRLFFPPDPPFRRQARPVPAPKLEPYTEAEGYAVMSAWKHYWAQKHVVVIRRDMKADPLLRHIPNESCLNGPERLAYKDAMQDFVSRWPEAWALENRFTPSAEFVIVPESDLPKRETRPHIPANASGYFAFSAVGFSGKRSRAVLYVVHRDGIYGDGSLFLLRKNRSGEWEVLPGEGCAGWIT